MTSWAGCGDTTSRARDPNPRGGVLAPVRGGFAVPGAAGVVGVDGRPVLRPHPVPEHRVQLLAGILGLDLEWELLLK